MLALAEARSSPGSHTVCQCHGHLRLFLEQRKCDPVFPAARLASCQPGARRGGWGRGGGHSTVGPVCPKGGLSTELLCFPSQSTSPSPLWAVGTALLRAAATSHLWEWARGCFLGRGEGADTCWGSSCCVPHAALLHAKGSAGLNGGGGGQLQGSLTSLFPLCVPKGSGDSSLEKEFSSAIVGAVVSTPNSQHSSPSRSLSGECPPTPLNPPLRSSWVRFSGGTEILHQHCGSGLSHWVLYCCHPTVLPVG